MANQRIGEVHSYGNKEMEDSQNWLYQKATLQTLRIATSTLESLNQMGIMNNPLGKLQP